MTAPGTWAGLPVMTTQLDRQDELVVRDSVNAAANLQRVQVGTFIDTFIPAWVEIELDFGTTPEYSKVFTVTDADSTSNAVILLTQSALPATGRVGNDCEWDQLLLAAAPGDGSFTITAIAIPGPVAGNRRVQYQIIT